MLAAHLALMFLAKLLFPGFNLFFLLVGVSISGIDAFLPILRLRSESYHCGSIFHSIWLPLAGAALLLILDTSWSMSLLAGGLVHLLTDSIDMRGRPWLYPFSHKAYGIALIPYDFKEYVSNPICIGVEVASILFIVAYVFLFGIDLPSLLWFFLLIPLFVVFALHQWKKSDDVQ